jgi:hypothetical protein
MSLKNQLMKLEQQFLIRSKPDKKEPCKVYCRCVFDRIIDIDSKNERFDADVVIELAWQSDDVFKAIIDPNYLSKINFIFSNN